MSELRRAAHRWAVLAYFALVMTAAAWSRFRRRRRRRDPWAEVLGPW